MKDDFFNFDDELKKELKKLGPEVMLAFIGAYKFYDTQNLFVPPYLFLKETNGKIDPIVWEKQRNKIISNNTIRLSLKGGYLFIELLEDSGYTAHAEYAKEIIRNTEAMIEELEKMQYRKNNQETENGR